MPRYDFRSPRLFVDAPMAPSAVARLSRDQTHYLLRVLRRQPGDQVLVFNGRDGEWLASIAAAAKREAQLELIEQTRPQTAPGDLHYLFAPLKHARVDYTVQKAVEMGVSRLRPIISRHAQVERVNLDRMRANVIEAAEQCGVLHLPAVEAPVALTAALRDLGAERVLIFCDEDADVTGPVEALAGARSAVSAEVAPLAVLIGPEGGFADEERAAILRLPRTIRLALGPRILRADTAAVAALALVQAVLGDWRNSPPPA
jgi:16S rRNA (uracil1498-N3)-methyltransferase